MNSHSLRAAVPVPRARSRQRLARLTARHTLSICAASVGAAALAWPVQAQVQASEARTYQVPAGPLADALNAFGRASGAMLVYASSDVAGRQSNGLQGRYTVAAGLASLLAGSGIEAVRQDNGGYALRRQEQTAPPPVARLAPVAVTGREDGLPPVYAGNQVAAGARIGMLGNRDILDTPFNTVSYTETYVRDRQAQDLSSVIGATDPGVYVSGSTGMLNDSFSLRGFGVASSDVAFNGLYGVVPYWRATPEFAERIEVLKGPTALVNGMPPDGSVGGSINLVPKRAGEDPLTRVTTTYMSDRQFGGHVDMGRRFGADNAVGIRVNGLYRQGDGAVEHQAKRAGLASLALDYRSQRARLSADVYTSRDHVDGLNRGISLAPGQTVPRPPRPDTLLGPAWTYTDTKDRATILRGEFDLTPDITAHVAYGHSRTDFDAVAGSTYTVFNAAGDYRNNFAHQRIIVSKDSAEAGATARFRTGLIGHAVSLSGTYYQHDYRFGFVRNMLAQDWVTNLYDPQWGPAVDRGFSSAHLPQTAALRMRGVGIADTLSLADDRVQLTLGVRRQNVVSDTFDGASGTRTARYDESATTPAVALLLKATDRISLYANYIEGLSQGATAPVTAQNAGEVFPPFRTRQQEVGAKMDLGSVGLTFSAFQIRRPSSYTDPVSNVFSLGGEQRNRGLELGVFGEPVPGLRVMGGIAYTHAVLTRTAGEINQGKRATNLPTWQAKLGVDWDVPHVDGLSLTGNVVSVSKIYINADNTLTVPGRTVFDAGARLRTALAGHPLVLRAMVHNVTNKAYWAGALSNGLGAPRTYLMSATLDF